jgi:hypothetical protein
MIPVLLFGSSRAMRVGMVLVMALVAICLASTTAYASVKHEGTWPDAAKEKALPSFDVSHVSRETALKKLADAAGWNLVVRHVESDDVGDVHLKNLPPSKVLDLVLGDGKDYVVKRDGDIVTIDESQAEASSQPSLVVQIPPIPAIPPVPAPPVPPAADDETKERGEDRLVTGGNARIEKDEIVHDVTVLGGNLEIFGRVTGDIAVMGGNVKLHEGTHIDGDVSSFGGTVNCEKGVTIDGDVNTVGGNVHRSDKCKIRGQVVTKGGDDETDEEDGHASPSVHESRAKSKLKGVVSDIGGSMTSAALLFAFGAVLLALAPKRMEMLRGEVATRPMRSLAVGVLGIIGGIAVLIALCITIVGIPIAAVGLVAGVLGVFAGICAVLTVVGQALLKHKTPNQYVHLALGCALFFVGVSLPYVGDVIKVAVALIGIGILVATRAGGLIPSKKKPAEGPYRTSTPPADAPLV